MNFLFLFFFISQMSEGLKINFHTASFEPITEGVPIFSSLLDGNLNPGLNYVVIQFSEIPTPEERKNIGASYGIKFTPWYIHENAFIVSFVSDNPLKKIEEIKEIRNVRSVFLYKPAFKFTKDAWELFTTQPDLRDKFYVQVFHDSLLMDAVNQVINLGGEILFIGKRDLEEAKHLARFGFIIEAGKLAQIANNSGVFIIGRLYEKNVFNDASRWVIQTNVSVDTSIWARGIRGEGVIIGHNDNGLDPNHCFFNGTIDGQPKIVRLFDYNGGGFANGDHGTHTAGSALGGTDQQSTNKQYKGMAKRARLVSQEPLAPDPPGFYNVLLDAYNEGARIHTNSWGYQCNAGLNYCGAGGYDLEALDIDNFVWNYIDMTVFFAAANGGDCGSPLTCGNGRRISRPATAKNDITVVATRRANNQEYKTTWSSFGAPNNLGDYRFGTDLTAPGENVNSADNNTACGIVQMSGTSMATPTAAGAGALVVQYYKEGWYGNGTKNSAPSWNPSSALVRATLLASCRDMLYDVDDDEGGPANSGVPNIYEGAGRITLEDALWFGEPRKLAFVDGDLPYGDNQFNTGDSIVYTINVLGSSIPLIIILSWIDYVGTANTYPVIVNNLNLKVVDPSGNTYKGNVTSNGWSVPNTGSFDALNTWELFKLQNPSTGEWKIIVKGANIPQPKPAGIKYPFAIVVTGNFDQISKLGTTESFLILSSLKEGILLNLNFFEKISEILIFKKEEKEKNFSLILKEENPPTPYRFVDRNVKIGNTYEYKVMVISGSGNQWFGPVSIKYDYLTSEIKAFSQISGSKLKLNLYLEEEDEIELYLKDPSGRNVKKIVENRFSKGNHSLVFDLSNYRIPSGIYFLNIKGKSGIDFKIKISVLY